MPIAAASPLPKVMRAAMLRSLKTPLTFETMPVPVPGPGEVLVKVKACGVCHSDLHAIDGDWDPPPVLPLIPGHEVTGHVAALGPGVSSLAVGDRIGVPWVLWCCGTCELCLAGMETFAGRPKRPATASPAAMRSIWRLPPHFAPDCLSMLICARSRPSFARASRPTGP